MPDPRCGLALVLLYQFSRDLCVDTRYRMTPNCAASTLAHQAVRCAKDSTE